jgi:hypothetical protein
MIETNRQVKFSVMTEVGIELTDAFYFSEEQYASLTEKDIDALIQKRVNDFVFNYRNPPTPPEPTAEDAQALVAALEQQQVQLDAAMDEALTVKSVFEDSRFAKVPFDVALAQRRAEVAESLADLDAVLPVNDMPVLKVR